MKIEITGCGIHNGLILTDIQREALKEVDLDQLQPGIANGEKVLVRKEYDGQLIWFDAYVYKTGGMKDYNLLIDVMPTPEPSMG